MTERTPVGGDFRFTYGRIASPDNDVRRGGALMTELEAEYSAGFNGQRWGEPAVLLTDQQGALLVRELVFSGAGGVSPASIWAFNLESPSQTLQFNSQNLANPSAAVGYGFNGTATPETQPAFEQLRILSNDNAASTLQSGVQAVALPAQWNNRVTAAENVAASVTRAAPGAGIRHLVQGFEFTLSGAGNSPQDLLCRIRDGAGGTILWESYIFKDVGGQSVTVRVDGISLPISANVAMVAEFSAAAGANTFQSINVRGVTVT